MSSMISLKSFSSALAAFCMLVFVYSFMPDSFAKISQFLKYLTIISTIIILMMFYRILEQTETSVEDEQQGNDTENSDQEIKLKRSSPKALEVLFNPAVIGNAILTNFDPICLALE